MPNIMLDNGEKIEVPDVASMRMLAQMAYVIRQMAYVISQLTYDQMQYLQGLHAGATGLYPSNSGFQFDRGKIQGEFLNREATNYRPESLPIDLSPVIQTLRADLTALDKKVEGRLNDMDVRVKAINPNWGTF